MKCFKHLVRRQTPDYMSLSHTLPAKDYLGMRRAVSERAKITTCETTYYE